MWKQSAFKISIKRYIIEFLKKRRNIMYITILMNNTQIISENSNYQNLYSYRMSLYDSLIHTILIPIRITNIIKKDWKAMVIMIPCKAILLSMMTCNLGLVNKPILQEILSLFLKQVIVRTSFSPTKLMKCNNYN